MVLYELNVTIPPQTAEADAVTETVRVEQILLANGMIFIDPASNGEVRAQLRIGETPILPHPNSATVSVPGRTGPSPLLVSLPGVPNVVELRAWAPNADFPHDVIAQFATGEQTTTVEPTTTQTAPTG